jgi:hypothetical protein
MYMICWILLVDIYRPLFALILLQRDLRRRYQNGITTCAMPLWLPCTTCMSTYKLFEKYPWQLYLFTNTDAQHYFHTSWCTVINNNTTGVTIVAEPSGTPEITTRFYWGSCCSMFLCFVDHYSSLCPIYCITDVK